MALVGEVPLPLNEEEVSDSITCVWLNCGKYRQPGSIYCPHHQVTAEWEAGEPERKKRQARLHRQMLRIKEKLLAKSPLAALQPEGVEPLRRKRRA